MAQESGKEFCLIMQETHETHFQSLFWEDILDKEMATHSSVLAWEIPWTEKAGGLGQWVTKELHTD